MEGPVVGSVLLSALLVALVHVVKTSLGLTPRMVPVAALVLGVVLFEATYFFGPPSPVLTSPFVALVGGLVAGLSAVGMHSTATKTLGK